MYCPWFLVLGLCCAAMAQDARQIILRSAALDQRDIDIARNYAYTRRSEQRRLDASGKVKSVESRTHEVLVLYGQPYDHRGPRYAPAVISSLNARSRSAAVSAVMSRCGVPSSS